MPKKEAPCDSNSLKSCSFPISEGSLVPKPGHTFQSPKRRYLIKSALSGCNLYATKWEWLPTPVFCSLKNDRMISIHFQGKPFNITVIQVYPPTSNAEEAEVEQFCEDLQDLLELTPKKDVLFIIGDWNAKVESQEITWGNRQVWPWNME